MRNGFEVFSHQNFWHGFAGFLKCLDVRLHCPNRKIHIFLLRKRDFYLPVFHRDGRNSINNNEPLAYYLPSAFFLLEVIKRLASNDADRISPPDFIYEL